MLSKYKTSPDTDRTAVRRYIVGLAVLGWKAVAVDDGEGDESCEGEMVWQVVDRVMAVEDATVRFVHPEAKGRHCLYFVLGNSPDEVLCDSSMGEKWDDDLKAVEVSYLLGAHALCN